MCIRDRLISIIAAVAEMGRENIRVQTMAGREQKAREGKWNGGFAPYGYLSLIHIWIVLIYNILHGKYGMQQKRLY